MCVLTGSLLITPPAVQAAAEIDVALSYSQDAADRKGGEDNLQVQLANAIAGTNADHDRSGTSTRLHIAGFYKSNANPVDEDNGTVVGWVASNAAYQDVRDFADGVGADLVSYYAHTTGAAGNAYQPGRYSAMAEQWLYHLLVAHELGHNQGCDHRDGHENPKSIMLHNYCGGGAQGYFSNPYIWVNGINLLGTGSCLGAVTGAGGDNAYLISTTAEDRAETYTRFNPGPKLDSVVRRWRFNAPAGGAPSGTTVTDEISGTTLATIQGNGATYTGDALRLPGGTGGSGAAYIDLPSGLITGYTDVTIEIWATPLSVRNWGRILDFNGGTTSSFLYLSSSIGTDLNTQRFKSTVGGSTVSLDSALPTVAGVLHHYTITFDDNGSGGGRWQWYRDGDAIAYLDVAYTLASIPDVNNWLGRSIWSGDDLANCDYTEVRISDVAMTPHQVLANYQLGTDWDSSTVNLGASDSLGQSSFSTAGQWSDGLAPAAGKSYETFNYDMRTPADGVSHSFAGDALKVSGGRLLYKGTGGVITVNDLILDGSSVLFHASSGNWTLSGNMTVNAEEAKVRAKNGPINLAANLDGSGSLLYVNDTVTLSGNNAAFSGKTMIGDGRAGNLSIDSEARLGAVPAGFTSDHLTLNRGTLLTTATMTLSNDNRGILLGVSGGTFDVAAGTTLTLDSVLSSPTTAANVVVGGLSKVGAGTLILSTTSSSFKGGVWLDSGSTSASDGIVRLVNNQALANARSPFLIRNNNSGSSTLQLDGASGNVTLSQGINVSCRNNAVATIQNLGGTNTLSGFIALNTGGSLFNIRSDAGQLVFSGNHQYVGSLTGGRTYNFTGNGHHLVSGAILNSANGAPISLSKSGAGTLTLSGNNTYGSTTTVSGGMLLVNGSISGGGVTVGNTATLGGNGTLGGPVAMQFGSTLAPGTSIGKLTLTSFLNLQAGSTTRMEIGKMGGVATNDAVVGLSNVGYGGTLIVTNLGPDPLAAGDSYQLFGAASYAGAFSAMNLPALSAQLAWSFDPANGVLRVVSTVPTNVSVSLSAGTLGLSWPEDHTGWRLETNAVSLTDSNSWFTLNGSTLTNLMILPVNTTGSNVFFRLTYP